MDGETMPSDSHQFFRVAKLVPLDQDVRAIPPGTRVKEALALMKENGFSQLPVVAGTTVIGVFSYRSFARELGASVRRQDDPLEAPVDDLLEDLSFVRATDDVGEILRHLDADDAVLVGEETNLIAVATTTDVISFLWEATRPFVLLQDIELAVRDLVRSACPSSAELEQRIGRVVAAEDGRLKAMNELSLGELIHVVTQDDNFGQSFRHRFGRSRDLVISRLEPIREIRNKVFHFRDEVAAEELDLLVEARRWLLRKVLAAQAP